MRQSYRQFREWMLGQTALAFFVYYLAHIFKNQLGMADTTSSTLSSDMVSAYIADKTLLLAMKELRIDQLADKATLPRRSSKTFQYTRYDRLTLPQSTLTEGVTPSSTQMSITTVTATVEQWGQIVVITDIAELVIKHPVLQKAIELLALAAAEVVDREDQEVLLAGTNVQYANAKSSRPNLLNTDVMTTNEVRTAVANLRTNGARTYDSQNLMGVVDPSVEADMTADTTFVTAASYSNITALKEGEVGKWMGVRWLSSNFLYTFTGAANTAFTITDVASGGSIAQTTTVYFVVTAVNTSTGFEEVVYQQKSVTTATDGLSTHSIAFTAPSTTGYTYNVYAGTTSGTTYQVTTGIAASGTYTLTSVPSSGTTNPAVPATGVEVHTVYIFGKEAFTSIKLDGMSLQTYITPKGSSDSDPIEQRRKAGWKLAYKAVICNNAFFRRIECGSAY